MASEYRRMEIADAAVVAHLVRLIQDSADVRYHVGGWGTQMRDLLVESLTARGVEKPLEHLRPVPHHADDEPRVKRLERELDELRAAARAYLESEAKPVGMALNARERLQGLL